MPGYDFKRISDPVHHTIGLSELETDVVNTQVFQRLRRVSQLGLTELVFPSAGYSRFAHSLGVCHMAGRVLDAVEAAGTAVAADDRCYFRLAGLLHDIGHYPFSHATEKAVEEYYSLSVLLAPAVVEVAPVPEPDPAVVEVAPVLEPDPAVATAAAGVVVAVEPSEPPEKRRIEPYLGHENVGKEIVTLDPELQAVFARHGVDPERIWATLRGESDFAANLISSDFDADRIDYLLRTSHHSGVPYGAIDVDYLLTQLRVYDGRICITPKAIGAADHFLLSRFFDYEQIAFSKAVVGLELCLLELVDDMLAEGALDFSTQAVREAIATGQWQGWDDAWMMGKMRLFGAGSGDELVARKAAAVLERTPPALIGECICMSDEERQFTERKAWARLAIEAIAEAAGVDPKSILLWSTSVKITKMGARIAIEEVMEDDGQAGVGELVPVLFTRDGNSVVKPIVSLPSSLMSVVAGWSYQGIRLFALMDTKDNELRNKLRQAAREQLVFLD